MNASNSPIQHYEYVFRDGNLDVYDIDNAFNLVKSIALPLTSAGVRGAVASAVTGMLYISYGPDSTTGGSLLEYDLAADQVVWAKTYRFGIDSMSVSPDGKTIYMPTGELNPGGLWEVIDAGTGNVKGVIDSGGVGPHNTIVNASGTHVYLGPRGSNYLVKADASTYRILQRIGPLTTADADGNGVRPFTINSSETLAFITATGALGFQVGDIATGQILYTLSFQGFSWDGSGGITAPSHGISISPDEKEVYVIDAPNSYVHVFDIRGLPGSAPVQVADIQLNGKITGREQGCAYDCLKDGWLHHSRDGRYVFVGDSGDVIDTSTRTIVASLPSLADTRKSIEIDFQNNAPVWAMGNRSSTGVAQPITQTKAEPAIWRPDTGTWWIIPQVSGPPILRQWGSAGDVPVPGDYDGDGKTDTAVWTPSTGTWWVVPSSNPGNIVSRQWGSPGDITVQADYDGDGKIDFAVWTPYSGNWWVVPSSNPGTFIKQNWGEASDIPVTGDYDGDGKADFAVWTPSSGVWSVIPSSAPQNIITQQWGSPGDITVQGDYDGDGITDFAVWTPYTGNWWIIPSSNPGTIIKQQWGFPTDIPVPGDYDGDGKTDIAVWRPSEGKWYIIPSSNPANTIVVQWGLQGDIPLAGYRP